MTGFELQTLESEATALPTEPQPLPLWKHMIAVFSINPPECQWLIFHERKAVWLGWAKIRQLGTFLKVFGYFLSFIFFAKMFNLRWQFYAAI